MPYGADVGESPEQSHMGSAQYIFDEFELDVAAFELRRSGVRVHLERMPMELLIMLISRRGELVSREEIAERLWGSGVFIDTTTAINTAIRKVRQALGDTVECPRYVLTVPAKGYRFIRSFTGGSVPSLNRSPVGANSSVDAQSPIQTEDSEKSAAATAQQAISSVGEETDVVLSTPTKRPWLIWTAAAAILPMIMAGIAYRHHSHSPPATLIAKREM